MNKRILIPLVALALVPVGAVAKTSSPAPDAVGSDCSWQENGQTIVVGNETFTCHCARLMGPNGAEILCRWWADSKLPAKKRAVKKRAVARYAIGSAVLSHA